MPRVWGLDLGEITWSKFGRANMWNTHYHLRRTKFIIYQLAMILCVVSESLATAALSDYNRQQMFLQNHSDGTAREYYDDYVTAASFNTWTSVILAFVFGAAFFFDLIWPERYEPRWVRMLWKVCAVLAVVFELASAITLTMITATRHPSITGVGRYGAETLLTKYGLKSSFVYRKNGRAVGAVVFAWLGFAFAMASAIVLFLSQNHDAKFGDPYSKHYREAIKGERNNNPEVEMENLSEPPRPSTAMTARGP